MSQPNATAAVEVNLPMSPPTKFERERAAFFEMLPDLLVTHRGQFVAIHEGRVVDAGSDRLSVARRVLERIGPADIFVARVAVELETPHRSGILRDLGRREPKS